MNENGKELAPLARKEFFNPTPEQVALIKTQICKDLTDMELALFLEIAKQRGLNPLLNQIYAQKRRSKNHKTGQWEDKLTFVTAIDGFLIIAERTGQMQGQKTWTTGDLKTNTLKGHAIVYRQGREASEVEIDFEEFKQTNAEGQLLAMWKKMPKWMIQKVALARCLDRSFPEDLSGLYTTDEMPPVETIPEAVKAEVLDFKQKPVSVETLLETSVPANLATAKPAKRARPTKNSKVEFVQEPEAFEHPVSFEDDTLPGDFRTDASDDLPDDYNQESPAPLDDPWEHILQASVVGKDGTQYQGMKLKQIGEKRVEAIFRYAPSKERLTENDVVNIIECLAKSFNYTPKPQGLDTSEAVMPFGKHKGKKMSEMDAGYWSWLQENKPELIEKFPQVKEFMAGL